MKRIAAFLLLLVAATAGAAGISSLKWMKVSTPFPITDTRGNMPQGTENPAGREDATGRTEKT